MGSVSFRQSRLTRWLVNISLFIGSILFVIIMLEVALRFTNFKLLLKTPMQNYYQTDSESGFDITPNSPPFSTAIENVTYKVWSNELGCFDKPYQGEKDHVLLVGDSFTWGYAPFDDKWGTRLENLLGMRVLKCGVSAYGTKQELIKALKVITKVKSPPKLLIVGYCSDNDFNDDYLFPNRTVINGYLVDKTSIKDKSTGTRKVFTKEELIGQVENWGGYGSPKKPSFPLLHRTKTLLLRHSILMNMAKYQLLNVAVKFDWIKEIMMSTGLLHQKKAPRQETEADKPEWMEKAWEDHFSNIRELKKAAVESGTDLLVVYIPRKYHVYDFLGGNSSPDQRLEKLKPFFEKEGIAYIDLTSELRNYADQKPKELLDPVKDLYWRYDEHWNIRGNHLVGLIVSRYILENDLLHTPMKEEKIREIEKAMAAFK